VSNRNITDPVPLGTARELAWKQYRADSLFNKAGDHLGCPGSKPRLGQSMRMKIMEPKLLNVVEAAEYRELGADDLSLVSGGEKKNAHLQIAGFVRLDINWNSGLAVWRVGSGPVEDYQD
jgi:hypothetical protein